MENNDIWIPTEVIKSVSSFKGFIEIAQTPVHPLPDIVLHAWQIANFTYQKKTINETDLLSVPIWQKGENETQKI